MSINKIKQKYLTKLAVLYGTYGLAGALALCGVIHTTESAKKDPKTTRIVSTVMYSLSISAVSLMFLWIMLDNNKRANKFALHATQNYIKSVIENDSELKPYESVILNKDAMQQIATTISNHLRPSEQQDVLDVIESLAKQEKITSKDLDIAYKNIRQIIEDHIHVHPEFMPIIISQLGNADYLAYVKKQQEKNARLMKEKTL